VGILMILWKMGYTAYVMLHWNINRVLNNFQFSNKPIHILFCMVDHFEPGTGKVSKDEEIGRVNMLLDDFPKIACRHHDCNGNILKRTWFFPPHYHRYGHLRKLVSLCEKGYGEIELHLHHGESKLDTSQNLEKTLRQCIFEYSEFGIFGYEDNHKRYGFIHGNWALDNSLGNKLCGVNNELEILDKTGCYADFTFPSMIKSTPLQINSIYYALDDPCRPKSYNKGVLVKKCGRKEGDLMIIQGPVFPHYKNDMRLKNIRVFGDAIDDNPIPDGRIDRWIKTGIHVKGRSDWLIVKMHTHGATDYKTVLGKSMDDICYYLESKYNDGTKYFLHYVTARELYNIIKAIEAGEEDNDPNQYRNYVVQAPQYDSSPSIDKASEILNSFVFTTYIDKRENRRNTDQIEEEK
jgi:hypothetical protein